MNFGASRLSQFGKFERLAGFFVLFAIFSLIVSTCFVAFKQGWFLAKHHYIAILKQGEGLHSGTPVQIAGLRAGSVEDVILTADNKIQVSISVNHDFATKVKKDSLVRLTRPFIISDKVVEITPGSVESTLLKDGEVIASQDTVDIMDLLGGGHLGPYLDTLDSLLKNIQVVIQAFSEPTRSQAVVQIFDEALPMMQDIREMTQQMTRHKNLAKTLKLSADILPDIAKVSNRLPDLTDNSTKIMGDIEILMAEMNKVLPSLVKVAPQLPEASQKSVQALTEAITVLKAMQRSFFLKGAVKDIKEEEAAAAAEAEKKNRKPAGSE